jgi:acyl-coenzyme A thioesterase PaaI-like protein
LDEHPHPSVRGRERELGRFTTALRRLVALSVTSAAPATATAEAARALEAISDRLQAFVPDELPYLYVTDVDAAPEVLAPFDVVTGPYNPLALPVEIALDPPRALGHARFTKPYEGPPGCVHGAVLCGVFDMVFTAANGLAQAAGPTVELNVRYRRPTRLETDTTFEAWISGRSGRITTTTGRALQNGVVTLEATGRFVRLSRERVLRLGQEG